MFRGCGSIKSWKYWLDSQSLTVLPLLLFVHFQTHSVMCPREGTNWLVAFRENATLLCSAPLGISDPLLSVGPNVEPLRSLFANKVDLRCEKLEASRKDLVPVGDGVIDVRFPIPGSPRIIVDPLRGSRQLPRRPISGTPCAGKVEDLRRPDPRGRINSRKFMSISSSSTDEALSLRWASGSGQ